MPAYSDPPANSETDPAVVHSGPRKRAMKITLVVLAAVIVLIVAGGLVLHLQAKAKLQARILEANTDLREAVKLASQWLKKGAANEAAAIEEQLVDAMAAGDLTEKGDADAVLESVRRRAAELTCEALFDTAKARLGEKAIGEAFSLLDRYLKDPLATRKNEARQLLADFDLAASEAAAMQTLLAMSDEQFAQFSSTGRLQGSKVTHPVLFDIQVNTLKQSLEKAARRREADKLAAASRARDAHAIAQASQQEPQQDSLRPMQTPGQPADESPAATQPVVVTADGFTPLFNGRDLTGWKINPTQPGNWRVENGILIGSDPVRSKEQRISPLYERVPFGSHLYTDRSDYKNFHLRVEVKVNDAGNSGIYFRSEFHPINDSFPTFPPGYEAELAAGHFGALFVPSAGLLTQGNTTLRTSDWVTIEVIAASNHITILVNGEKASDFVDPQRRYASGHIALQCWERQSVVMCRKIEIKEMVSFEDQLASTTLEQMSPSEMGLYLKQQIVDLEAGRVVDNVTPEDTFRRRRAIRNLKALGSAASPAVPVLAWVTAHVQEKDVASGASELLAQVGGVEGCKSLLGELQGWGLPYTAPRHPAEDALVKLLPLMRKQLTLNEAIDLWELYQRNTTRKKFILPAIENAWQASGLSPNAVAMEIVRRAKAESQLRHVFGPVKPPIPSPMNWKTLANGKLYDYTEGVVMQIKPPWILWAEDHPEEAALQSEINEKNARAAQQRQEYYDRMPSKPGKSYEQSQQEAERRAQEERDYQRARKDYFNPR